MKERTSPFIVDQDGKVNRGERGEKVVTELKALLSLVVVKCIVSF
jgi:hypothetical protein